ncbi:hypothetical protein HHL19_18735 [Streptomyces sp. R302]|uniref:hypothetical protein n=1 Tax=unclassified Streptomyces TaxID=2593676 RepID=UPI00145CAACF|nr:MULTISPECIES: hypothetical protein [unclassified Streptomyces]NML54784.1 hypothetical protein [Streptomyces sp. R301]NML80647.1 hypothetical protein [Streptomyces sp. R302]
MSTIYQRTENGTTTPVSRRAVQAEINAAVMDKAKKTVRTVSSINRTDYSIEYRDGRQVRLVRVHVDETPTTRIPFGTLVTVDGRVGKVCHSWGAYQAVGESRLQRVQVHSVEFLDGTEGAHTASEMLPYAAPAEAKTDESTVTSEETEAGAEERCMPVNGGRVHTLTPGAPAEDPFPQCRTGGSSSRETRYRIVTAQLTCRTCLAHEARRKAARAHQ